MGFGKSIGELLVEIIKEEKERNCNECINYKTMNCPNSSKCYSIIGKPYFKAKEG